MAPSLARLRSERGTCKATITKIESFLNTTEALSEEALKCRLVSLRRAAEKFEVIQSNIYELLDDGQTALDNEEAEVANFEERVVVLETRINSLLKTFIITSNQSEASDVDEDNLTKMAMTLAQAIRDGNQGPRPQHMKLPQLDIPKFSGEYTDWRSFRDLYKRSIHQNADLSAAQKFQYLQGLVEGKAKAVIKHIPATDENYEDAWQSLEKRFDKKQCILFSHIDAFFGLKNVPDSHPIGLRGLLNSVLESINAVDALGYKERDVWLMNFILRKVDKNTHDLWTAKFPQTDVPSWSDFLDFLERRCDALEASRSNNPSSQHQEGNSKSSKTSKPPRTTLAVAVQVCEMCEQGAHFSYQCPKFVAATPPQRLQLARKCKLCFNCLRNSHTIDTCQSSNCRKCQLKHNTMLHEALFPQPGGSQVTPVTSTPVASDSQSTGGTQPSSCVSSKEIRTVSKQILLPTAIILVRGGDGRIHKGRALIDSCSQSNFVTASFARKSWLPIFNQGGQGVSGIGKNTTSISNATRFTFTSQDGQFMMTEDFMILENIVEDQPRSSFAIPWHIPPGIQLADMEFNVKSGIDILLGAEVFIRSLRPERIEGSPILQDTAFGYIAVGNVAPETPATSFSSCISTCLCSLNKQDPLHKQMENFWLVEEPPSTGQIMSKEEQLCEEHFIQNTTRDTEGRYSVRLPVRENIHTLGDSEMLARKRFLCTERKLQRNSDLREKYIAFMREYESLGHMRPLPVTYQSDRPAVYLPHHPVIKASSSSTPVRVVFDASAKTSTGVALNDVLMVGPKTQDDLFNILLRFREHNIIIKADVKKMFRQVLVHPDDQNMQRIFWRESPQHPIQTYLLSTVTYGTGSASYLSTRCIKQLLEDEGDTYPLAKVAASRDFYVDDFLSGAPTVSQAQKLQSQIEALMLKGGFQLSKWMSNCPEALRDVPYSEREIKEPLDFTSTETISALGLQLNPVTDEFSFDVQINSQSISKRSILSEMSKTYDPLGFLAPVTIQAKILMQSLWQLGADWDDSLEENSVAETWREYQRNLTMLTDFRIPRHLTSHLQSLDTTFVQLAVFCDASEKAYGACCYLQTIDRVTGDVFTSQLLCAKTRVAPLKQVSLPRLELCGAVLAMRLLQSVLSAITVKIHSIKAFTDSTIVLCWLSAEPTKWKTFVANRVSQIQSVLGRESWAHVPSAMNPADLASRGVSPPLLKDNKLWFNGPDMKKIPNSADFPVPNLTQDELEQKVSCVVSTKNDFWEIIERFSSHSKLIKCLAYWRRYFDNLKCLIEKKNINSGPLTVRELRATNTLVIRAVQSGYFSDDINRLSAREKLANSSRIRDLNPYLDDQKILRVGGRIANAPVSSTQKHPALIPDKHPFTQLIADKIHLETCHGGPQLMLYTSRQEYWTLRGLDVMKAARRRCVRCFRCQPHPMHQLMGDLPPYRLHFTKAFDKVGVDLCGYFLIKATLRRNASTKMYVTIFVCMVTHAVHLELVTDLSRDAFLAAFRRFISRRGKPSDVFCDNAKNFVGANRHLQEVRETLCNKKDQEFITQIAAEAQVNFHFIPPRSPHFGGMWESSVKSFKKHFYRIVGTSSLTQESMLTILAEIEMCLNSRPLAPMSSCPTDFTALSPGHFLIGRALNAVPDHDLTELPSNRLDKWQRNQQIVQHFWKRFKQEVFSQLQQRKKWKDKQPELRTGDLVVIIEDNLPPLSWILGRVTEIHVGRDGHVRVAKIRTQYGEYVRAITKLARLPEDVQNPEVLPGENGDELHEKSVKF